MDEYPVTFTKTLWTYTDYLELPRDGKVYQVLEGVLYMVPSPSYSHQRVSMKLSQILFSTVEEGGWGEVLASPMDVVLTETDVVQPDILFISSSRKEIIREQGIWGAPDLVVEIISPYTRKIDEKYKWELYEKHGVREYLLVYPNDEKVVAYRLEGGILERGGTYGRKDRLELTTIPMTLDLSRVFP